MVTLAQLDEVLARLGRADTLADTGALTMTYRDRSGVALLVDQIG